MLSRILLGLWALSLPISAVSFSTYQAHQNAKEYYHLGQHERAVESYKEAMSDGEHAEAHYNLGNTYYQSGQYHAAIDSYQSALPYASDEQKSQIHHNIGNSHAKLNQMRHAVASYQMALRFDPNNMSAKHNLELAVNNLSEYSEARSPEEGPVDPNTGLAPGDLQPTMPGEGGDEDQDKMRRPQNEQNAAPLPYAAPHAEPQSQAPSQEHILNMVEQQEQHARNQYVRVPVETRGRVSNDW